jgi:hypothetical protein
MARDASLGTIVKISPNMGTPVGWYFILKPFASLGFPFGAQQALTLILIWAAVAILIFQGPFSILISTCWCLSWYLSFEYSVMSRNYTVGILGVFALLGSYSRRAPSRLSGFQWWASWPLIVFSSVHFLALAPGLVALSYLLGKRFAPSDARLVVKHLWPTLLITLSIWILWPTGHGQMGAKLTNFFELVNLWHAVSLGVFPFLSVEGVSRFVTPLFVFCWFLVCRCGVKETISFALMMAGVNAVFVFTYFNHSLRHCGINWIILIGVAWVGLLKARQGQIPAARERRFIISLALVAVTLLNISDVTKRWKKEIQYPFTDAGATARYLIDNDLIREPIVCRLAPLCSSILGYIPTPTRFWYPGINQWGTHMFWDRSYALSFSLSVEQGFSRGKDFLRGIEGLSTFLFLSNESISNPGALGLTKIWESPRKAWGIHDERFVVYRWQSASP